MPLLHISLRAGKPEGYRQAIFDSLYRAMRDAVLRAEAGMGKSALLGYARSRGADLRILQAVGVEPEIELPFAALHLLDWVAPGEKVFFASTSEVYAGGVSAGIVPVPTPETVPPVPTPTTR